MTFGQRFKELRLDKNLTQQELADDFNKTYNYTFTKSAISQYENDKRTPEVEALINFALYFDVSLDYLMCLSEKKEIEVQVKDVDLVSEFIAVGNDLFDNEELSRKEKDMLFEKLSKMYFSSL